MTTDNQKKYEEAAKEFIMENPFLMSGSAKSGFLSGASFAEKQSWNAAIEKVLSIIMEKNHDYPIHHVYEELEKLKL